MNVLVIDTSIWISYFAGKPLPDIDLALKEGRAYLSPIVASELLSAQLRAVERSKLEVFLSELPLLETPFNHWSHVGQLRAKCSAKGVHVSTPDAHIAQCCLDLDGYLASEDTIFQKLAGLISLRILS